MSGEEIRCRECHAPIRVTRVGLKTVSWCPNHGTGWQPEPAAIGTGPAVVIEPPEVVCRTCGNVHRGGPCP